MAWTKRRRLKAPHGHSDRLFKGQAKEFIAAGKKWFNSQVKCWFFVLFLCVVHSAALRSEPFERAEVTRTVNLVSLLPEGRQAIRGDLIRESRALKTGGASRAELQFPDFTIVRVGSNSLFRFYAGGRDLTLDGGAMLFSSPKGAGGGKVRAGAITAAVTGSDFLISYVKGSAPTKGTSRIGNASGRVKVICLSHKVLVYFTDDPGTRVWLYPGQMSDIRVESKNLPRAVTVNHGLLLASSMLGEKGGFGPLPSQALLELIASKQASVPVDVPPIGHSEISSNSQIQDANLQAQAIQTAELTTVSNNDSRASSPPGKSGNKGSNGNKGNIENRGKNGNRGNIGNSGNSGNSGNGGNSGNSGNSGNGGNSGNRGNIENKGNSGITTSRAQANAQRTGR